MFSCRSNQNCSKLTDIIILKQVLMLIAAYINYTTILKLRIMFFNDRLLDTQQVEEPSSSRDGMLSQRVSHVDHSIAAL